MYINIRLCQFENSFVIAQNLQSMLSVVEEAAPDELLVFHEGAISGYIDALEPMLHLEREALPAAFETLTQAAQRRGVHLVAGSCLPEGDRWYNAALYFSPRGERAIYRKVNLAYAERPIFQAGDELPLFTMCFAGGEVRVAFQLCRELRFPEQWQYLAHRGADLFLYLTNAANPQEVDGVWRAHLISRAAENQRFVVSSNVAHPHQHCPTMIVAPSGAVLQEARTKEQPETLRATLDLSQNARWYLGQCRTDVVSLSYKGQAL